LIILLLLALIETVLDIPLLLAGELRELFLDNLSPGNWSALTVWADFLQGGGRFAMGLVAAITSNRSFGIRGKTMGRFEIISTQSEIFIPHVTYLTRQFCIIQAGKLFLTCRQC